jgi:enterochelin esterase-like enzyme
VGAGSGSGGTSGSGSGGSAVVDAGGTGGVGGSGSGSGGTVAPVDSSAGMETAGETSGAGGGLPDVTSDGDGDRIIGPTFTQDPLVTRQAGVPASRSFKFTMALAQSKYYTGAGQQNAVTNRSISVSVPMQYDPTKPAALLVTQDAQESGYLPAVIDNLIAMKQVPVIVSMYIANGGGDSVGNERGLEYDTVSGLYAEFVIKEVVPEAIAQAKTQLSIDLKITDNPNGHATLGGSSGGAAAFSMIWWHPDLFRLMIGFSPTLVSQVPKSSPFPNGCWVYHDLDPYDPTAPNGLVMHNCEAAGGFVGDSKPGACDTPLTQATCTAVSGCVWNTMNNRPIRVWHQSSQNDLDSGENEPATDHRNFDLANRRTAAELKARGYHYHYDHADGGNHNDDRVQRQTIVEAMKWLWRGYPID